MSIDVGAPDLRNNAQQAPASDGTSIPSVTQPPGPSGPDWGARLRRWFVWVLVIVFTFLLAWWSGSTYYRVFQRYSDVVEVSSVSVHINSAKYLTSNEADEISFTLENEESANTDATMRLLNGTEVEVTYEVGTQGPTNTVYSDTLSGLEKRTERVKPRVEWDLSHMDFLAPKPAGLSLSAHTSKMGNTPITKDLAIFLCPIPLSKWAAENLYLTGIPASIISLISSIIVLVIQLKKA